jgi:hypothetical protein
VGIALLAFGDHGYERNCPSFFLSLPQIVAATSKQKHSNLQTRRFSPDIIYITKTSHLSVKLMLCI